ncbi:hypothetical protein BU17DRAFT_45888 [Hysterangium stoloniferum]|nr:hypothetical protein BU17DRAFT_45888 [Hysterangium stoloniferum]
MTLPIAIIAGIPTPDTPIVKAALAHAQAESPPWLFNHVVRSWLFALKLVQAENALIDEETLSVAALLHDLGLADKYMTPDRRFEVDGAAAAVSFLKKYHQEVEGTPSTDSCQHRLRELTVWDSIALHATPSLASHSIPEVVYCFRGVAVDVLRQGLEHVPDASAVMQAVTEAFPDLSIRDKIRECFCSIVRHKPETTYDNILCFVGEEFVEGYKRTETVEIAGFINALRP